ncbi:MerR family transcriptional regulator [Streptomyces sp. NPDC101393]|uniref:helix-turn-helix domain-containing protein n=1 Tax=Streptomyces sp. NPDC101393 TaxID=3366141 RepID=UPI0038026D75
MNEDDSRDLLTIGELARPAGVPVKTLRSWSDRGLLPPAARTPAGYRLYGPDAPARLEIVRSLRQLGVGLAAIRAVLQRERGVAETAAHWADALDAQIRTLRLPRAVLRSAAARGTAAQELVHMSELARLSTRERRRIVADFIDEALDGVHAPAYRSGLPAATPDLPDDPPPNRSAPGSSWPTWPATPSCRPRCAGSPSSAPAAHRRGSRTPARGRPCYGWPS